MSLVTAERNVRQGGDAQCAAAAPAPSWQRLLCRQAGWLYLGLRLGLPLPGWFFAGIARGEGKGK